MPEQIEKILKDIYALDPELISRDAEIRALATALLKAKPVVTLREDFVRTLKAELLAPKPKLTPKNNVTGWLRSPYLEYLAPFCAVAVLIFMLLPAPLSYQPLPPPDITSSSPKNDAMETRVFADPAVDSVPTFETEATELMSPETAKMAVPASEPSLESDFGEAMIAQERPPLQLISRNRFESFQVAVDSMLGAAGFIVLRTVEEGELGAVVAVTPYLQSGFSIPITLSLREQIVVGREYSLGLYHDDIARPQDRGWFHPSDVLVFESRFIVDGAGNYISL